MPTAIGRTALYRRTLRVLVFAQLLSGAGLAAGIVVGALLAEDMLGGTGYSGVPIALFTAGAASSAIAIGYLSQTRGRRAGLVAGYLVGALGAGGIVLAATVDSVPLLLPSLLVYGSGTAAGLQARYAGTDLARPSQRGKAISTVLVATTVGAVVGPLLVEVTGDWAESFGIPALAGPFALAALAYAAAGLFLFAFLRPDPLLAERAGVADDGVDGVAAVESGGPGAIAAPESSAAVSDIDSDAALPTPEVLAAASGTDSDTGSGESIANGVWIAAVVMVVTQIVMVAIMTMTPIHIRDHGHGLAAAGMVIAVHVACMFLPSPLTGYLADRYGRIRVIVSAAVVMLGAGLVSGLASPDSVVVLMVGLGLLGLGWNLGLIGGSALLTDSVPVDRRAKTQGSVDFAVSVAGAAGGLSSGLVVAGTSYATLAIGGGVVALALLPILLRAARGPAAALR